MRFQSYFSTTGRITLALGATTLFAVLVWASQANMQDVVHGQGRIIPQSHTQQVQHLEGGIVQQILVHEGEVVKRGAPLFRINALAAHADEDEMRIKRLGLKAKQERLLAEQHNTANLSFSDEVQALDKGNSDILQSEQDSFQARKNEFERGKSVLEEQQRQKSLSIDRLKAEVVSVGQELDIAKRQLDINTRLHDKGVLSESQLLLSKANASSQETKFSQTQAQIPVLQAELAEIGHRKTQLLEERQAKATDELTGVGIELKQLEEKMKTTQDRVNRTNVTAPADGIVNRLLVTTPGAVVQPGAVLAELTPTDGEVQVEGKIRASDRGRVWLNQPVMVRVTAYDYSRFGAMPGQISDISADSFTDDKGGATFYRVRATLKKTSLNPDSPLLPGMTVDFHIQAGRRTVLQTILGPLLDEMWFDMAADGEEPQTGCKPATAASK